MENKRNNKLIGHYLMQAHIIRQLSTRLRQRRMSSRSYSDAVNRLNTLQTNAAALDAVRASGGRSSALAIPEMLEYLGGIGYTVCLYQSIFTQNCFSIAARAIK
jgi:hypothetical protein